MSKKKTEPVTLTEEDFVEWNKLIDDITNKTSSAEEKNPNIKQLGVSRKFVGVLGEARGLVLLHEENPGKDIIWYGGHKKDFDVTVEKKNIQIKSASTEEYSFRPLKVSIGNEDYKDAIKQIKKEKPNFKIIFEKIETSVRYNKADYWLFLPLVKDKYEKYFLLNKNELIDVIKAHYKRHVCKTPHPKSYNCYISQKEKTYNPILKKADSKLLDPHTLKKVVFD